MDQRSTGDAPLTAPPTVPPPAVRLVPALLRSCHPLPTATVTLLVTVLAATAGQDAASCATTGAAVLAGQLSVGWCNDAADAARDGQVRRADKPVAAGAVTVTTVWAAAWAALLLCLPLSLACGALAGVAHLTGVAAGWAYNLGAKATSWSWLPYAVGFASLPAFVTLGLPAHPWPAWWAVSAGALLGAGAHLANVLPDLADDLRTGIRGWPQRLGPATVRWTLPFPLVLATALLAFAAPGPAGALGWAAVVGAVLGAVTAALLARVRVQLPFYAAIAVAVVDVALLLGRGSTLG